MAIITQSLNGHAAQTTMPQGTATVPEALCSMNGFVKIGRHETRDHQCTGRGTSPEEAAANFFGCLDALEAGYAARAARQAPPVPLASRTQRLSLLVACGVEKALAVQDTDRVQRLLKATALVLAGCVNQEPDGTYAVRSQIEPEKTVYRVAGRACSCQDARQHAEDTHALCKHVLAVFFCRRLSEQEDNHNLV